MELEVLEQKRDRRGRMVHDPEERERLLAEYDASDLTQIKFAKSRGINYSTFTGWLKARRNKAKASAFEEAVIEPTASMGVELQLPNGIVLRSSAASPELVSLAKELLKGC